MRAGFSVLCLCLLVVAECSGVAFIAVKQVPLCSLLNWSHQLAVPAHHVMSILQLFPHLFRPNSPMTIFFFGARVALVWRYCYRQPD